jgi:Icc-related predicted phosphoesterase
MHLLHISDTHNCHHALHDLPAADIIIHSGDVSMAGTGKEANDFVEWFCGLDYEYKIFIAGNHDFCLDGKKREAIQRFLPANCYYLCHSGVEINGLKFWGAPYFLSDDINRRIPQLMAQIPDDTDILISHCPPYGILDQDGNHYGCPDLLTAVMKIAPRYHLFGHIHYARGTEKRQKTIFVNSAIVNERYELDNESFFLTQYDNLIKFKQL